MVCKRRNDRGGIDVCHDLPLISGERQLPARNRNNRPLYFVLYALITGMCHGPSYIRLSAACKPREKPWSAIKPIT